MNRPYKRLSKHTDKSKFDGGRPMVAPTGLGIYSNAPTNQNLKTGGYGIRPYETTGILLTLLSFRPKKNGPQKRNAHRRRSLPSANTGRAPSGAGTAMFAPTQWGIKNLFQKRFLRSFFLKKATLRAAAPPPAGGLPDKSKFDSLPQIAIPQPHYYKKFPNPLYEGELL